MPDAAEPASPRSRLGEVARVFLRLGCVAFGGPAAHIALMEEELVERRAWVSRDDFVDFLGATNLIPGPNSTEMAIHLGMRRAGFAGLVVAGVCFIAPAALLTAALAWAYVRYGARPGAVAALDAVKAAMIAVIVQALIRLGRTALRGPTTIAIAIGAAAAAACEVDEIAVLAAAGALAILLRRRRPALAAPALIAAPAVGSAPVAVVAPAIVAAAAAPVGLAPLFLVFLKIGSLLFGSGYVLLAFLRTELVERRHWLREDQLLDAIAAGQATPGPVFSTATFVGWLVAGPAGAAVATAGIFLPAFALVAISGPLVPRVRRSPTAGAVLDGVNAASLALMAVVACRLARASLSDGVTIVIAIGSAVALLRWRVNSLWTLLAAAAIGAVRGIVAR